MVSILKLRDKDLKSIQVEYATPMHLMCMLLSCA